MGMPSAGSSASTPRTVRAIAFHLALVELPSHRQRLPAVPQGRLPVVQQHAHLGVPGEQPGPQPGRGRRQQRQRPGVRLVRPALSPSSIRCRPSQPTSAAYSCGAASGSRTASTASPRRRASGIVAAQRRGVQCHPGHLGQVRPGSDLVGRLPAQRQPPPRRCGQLGVRLHETARPQRRRAGGHERRHRRVRRRRAAHQWWATRDSSAASAVAAARPATWRWRRARRPARRAAVRRRPPRAPTHGGTRTRRRRAADEADGGPPPAGPRPPARRAVLQSTARSNGSSICRPATAHTRSRWRLCDGNASNLDTSTSRSDGGNAPASRCPAATNSST